MNAVPHVVRTSDLPDAELIGDKIVVADYPERTETLWQTSALLHLAAGRTRNMAVRVLGSLPPERRNAANAQRALGELAFVLLSDFSRVSAGERPANFDSYVEIVRMYRPELLLTATRRAD